MPHTLKLGIKLGCIKLLNWQISQFMITKLLCRHLFSYRKWRKSPNVSQHTSTRVYLSANWLILGIRNGKTNFKNNDDQSEKCRNRKMWRFGRACNSLQNALKMQQSQQQQLYTKSPSRNRKTDKEEDGRMDGWMGAMSVTVTDKSWASKK